MNKNEIWKKLESLLNDLLMLSDEVLADKERQIIERLVRKREYGLATETYCDFCRQKNELYLNQKMKQILLEICNVSNERIQSQKILQGLKFRN